MYSYHWPLVVCVCVGGGGNKIEACPGGRHLQVCPGGGGGGRDIAVLNLGGRGGLVICNYCHL